MAGYDHSFLGDGFEVPLPKFADDLKHDVLSALDASGTELQEGFYTRYIHFSIATNKARRQPILVAQNINQKLMYKDGVVPANPGTQGTWSAEIDRPETWFVDDKVGKAYQLDNRYYYKNDWDKGHLARWATSAWGNTKAEAEEASGATMLYSNAALQHKNLNRDEWLELEDWVRFLERDGTDRICVFSGPIYTANDGEGVDVVKKLTPSQKDGPPADLPTAFFKVVCFVGKDDKLAVRAFIVPQDKQALKGRSNDIDVASVYQCTVREIEENTGLLFDERVKAANPPKYPEMHRVTKATVDKKQTKRPGVYIMAAMVNPAGADRGNEWVSVSNFAAADLDLTNWSIHGAKANIVIPSGEVRKVPVTKPLVNKGGSIELIDPEGNVVDRVSYYRVKEGEPITFHIDAPGAPKGVSRKRPRDDDDS